MLRDSLALGAKEEDGVGGWKEVQEGGDICILMADSCCCRAETNTTLYSNYPPIKNKLKKEKKVKRQPNKWEKIFTTPVSDYRDLYPVYVCVCLRMCIYIYKTCKIIKEKSI